MQGETKLTLPKWVGIPSIGKTLADTDSAIDQIASNSQNAFNNNSWTNTDPPAFENQLKSSYSQFSNKTLPNPNPAPSKSGGLANITPLYIKNYGDYTTQGTILNTIYQEFNAKIKGSVTLLGQAQTYSQTISQYSNQIKDVLKGLKSDIDTFTEPISALETTLINPLINIQAIINDKALSGFLIIFGVSFGLSVLATLLVIMFAFCKCCSCLRFFLHFIWNIIVILMIINFILSALFGVLASIGQDGIGVIKWVFGPDNLSQPTPVIIPGKAGQYLNICVNGNILFLKF
jgi:hypothetical protein